MSGLVIRSEKTDYFSFYLTREFRTVSIPARLTLTTIQSRTYCVLFFSYHKHLFLRTPYVSIHINSYRASTRLFKLTGVVPSLTWIERSVDAVLRLLGVFHDVLYGDYIAFFAFLLGDKAS